MARCSIHDALRRQVGRIGLLLIGATWLMQVPVEAATASAPIPAGHRVVANLLPDTVSPLGKPLPASLSRQANFLGETPSPEARQVANWAMGSGDNQGLPFMVIDKIRARVFVFDAMGLLRGTSMALLGFAHGDFSSPGIGTRKLHRVVRGNPGDNRQQRLASRSPDDKRISYGCINVPAAFFEGVVLQTFTGTSGIVYILPEVRKLGDFFPVAAAGVN
jgi:hypothetical protein